MTRTRTVSDLSAVAPRTDKAAAQPRLADLPRTVSKKQARKDAFDARGQAKAEQKALRTMQEKLSDATRGLSVERKASLVSAVAPLMQLGVSGADLAQGAHIVLKGDGGKYAEQFRELAGVNKRSFSSHYKDVKETQYELPLGEGLGGILCGKDADGNSWMQWEKHAATNGTKDKLLHLLDWVDHAALEKGQKNIGVAGKSHKTEKAGTHVVVDVQRSGSK